MNPTERIRSLLDPYFSDMRARGMLRYPAKEPPYDYESGGVPPEMFDGAPDHEGIVRWKVIPSKLTEADVDALEHRVGGPFPPLFRAYLLYGHFLGLEGCGARLLGTPSDDPLKELNRLIEGCDGLPGAGFVPFGDETNDTGPLCFDYGRRMSDGDCPVVVFDHDSLVDLDEGSFSDREVVAPLAFAFADSFAQLVDHMFAPTPSSGPLPPWQRR